MTLGSGVRVRLQRRERQGSAEEGRLEKEAEETQIAQKQPQPNPVWGLLGLQHLKEHSCQTLLGPVAAITGADALLFTQEVVLLPSASTVSKGLAEPGHCVVEVPGEHGPAGTGVWSCRQKAGRRLSLLLLSPSGVLATRVPRRSRRAAERQSRLIFVALQEGSSCLCFLICCLAWS